MARDGKKEFQICKDACENAGCFCPEEHIFHSTVANTPQFIRSYFYQKGFEDCKKEMERQAELNEVKEAQNR